MSIILTINNNAKFSRDAGTVEYSAVHCFCEGENKECFYCKGSGTFISEKYPFEINLTNANFSTIFNSLGVNFDYYGEIDPDTLLNAISRTFPELIERETVKIGNSIYCGIFYDKACIYLDILKAIAEEAKNRKELVIWG
jgi:hypothetical protein